LANGGAAETRGSSELFFALRERAIVEAELFSVFDGFLGEHTDGVDAVVLLDLRNSLTVGVAAVTQA
jgi:hypothetical protein